MRCLPRRASEIGNLSFDIFEISEGSTGPRGSFGITIPADTTREQATRSAVITDVAQSVRVAFNILLRGLCPVLGSHAKDRRDMDSHIHSKSITCLISINPAENFLTV